MSSTIGERVKELRVSAGMTVEQLAEASSVSNLILERIEKENINPSVAILNKICHALGTRTGTVLDGAEFAGPVHLSAGSYDNNAQGDYTKSNLRYHLLAKNKSDRNMEPFMIEVGYAPADLKATPGEGEEFLYILEGDVILTYGKETYALSGGDSIYFDSCVPHALSAAHKGETAKILAVTYAPML